MDAFIAQYCHRNDDKINSDMFNRKFDRPLVDYVVDTCKSLEVIPAITLVSWEFITDQTKIHSYENKKLSKDPKIRNNKALERLVQRDNMLYDLLVLHFRVIAKGRDEMIVRKVRVPKQIGPFFIRNGKKVLLLNQVVDNSTYVKGNVLNYKTQLYSIKLSTVKQKLPFLEGETLTAPAFRLDLFTKVTNPLIYFFAQYGFYNTIDLFGLTKVLSVVDDTLNMDDYLYLKVTDNVYIEVHEKALNAHEFIIKFVASLYDILKVDKELTIKKAYDTNYWLERLSEIFAKKKSIDKGSRILISFMKIMDTWSKRRLSVKRYHRKNTFTIVRWMMVNYTELLKKDSNDLRFKRVRGNETQAYFFNNYITRNVYSLLNTDNAPFEKYARLLNSIGEYTLLKSTQTAGRNSPTSLFRYERYNDFDAIDLSRYTLKGPTGLNGGKTKTSMKYRDIYPSHLGRYDLNTCSSDPGLTGYMTANVQLDEHGYFDTDNKEPDVYDTTIDKAINKFAEEGYEKDRYNYIKATLVRDEDGFIRLKKRMSEDEIREDMAKSPEKYGLYQSVGGLRLIPNIENRDANGFIVLSPRDIPKAEQHTTNVDGFIVLQKIYTKMELKQMEAGEKP